jgi:NADPH:quinone reductase-like Zn-dependent oxidoreductase
MGFFAENAISVVMGSIVMITATKWHWRGGVNTHYPKMNGKIVIITGANTGIGYECTNVIARLGAEKVILACRNPKLGNAAVEKLGHKNIEFM